MNLEDLKTLPWPVLLVQPQGSIALSPSAERVLGFHPQDVQALEQRFDVAAPSGATLEQAQLPWRRRDVPFEDLETWHDRILGQWQVFHLQAWEVSGGRLLLLEPGGRPAMAERADAAMGAIRRSLLGSASDLPLRELLHMLVESACDLAGARYGALGVLERDGSRLRDFIYVGLSEEEARRIGHLPEGKGLLGALIHERRTLRVADIAKDPRSIGFPSHHPPMRSFLGVPLKIGDRVFGNFYLTEKQGAPSFTEEDAYHLERFSTQAALAVAFVERTEAEGNRIFHALIQHAPYGVAYFPVGAGEPFGNATAERLLGRICLEDDPERTYELRLPDGSVLPPSEGPGIRALHGETSLNFEVLIARGSEPPIPALLSATPVALEPGAAVGALVMYQDVSTLKELERLRAEFVALVAHDMRTPVQSVMLQIETLLKRATGEAAWVPVKTLDLMKRNGQHLSRLIGDLLDASRIEGHQLHVEGQVFDAEQGVRDLLQRLQASLGARQVTVDARGAPSVYADPIRFDQILTNLLENAAKYSPGDAPIRIELDRERGGAVIRVRDQGPGIPPDELPHLFDRYFQGRAARKRRSGLGLGLYITAGLVEAHGGTIEATSTVGSGSTFEVWLPGPPQPAGEELPASA